MLSHTSGSKPNKQHGSATFEPRPKDQVVRNCTKVDKILQESIVNRIALKLLDSSHYSTTAKDAQHLAEESSMDFGDPELHSKWNAGGMISLAECSKLLTEEEKKCLKAQCGGLQTLLRNHHQVFKVIQGNVKLRDWREENKKEKEGNIRNGKRNKICWFFLNHPDGCPLQNGECKFIHEK